MSLVNQFSKYASKVLKPMDNEIIGATARVALILYASLIAPDLPAYVLEMLNNVVVRSVLIFLISYLSLKDPVTAALATVALMVSVMALHRREVQTTITGAVNFLGGAYDRVESSARKMTGMETPVPEKAVPSVPDPTVPTGVEAGSLDVATI